MTIEQIFKYYNQSLTFYRLVICKNKWYWNLVIVLFFLFYAVLFVIYFIDNNPIFLISGLLCLILGGTIGRKINMLTIKNYYPCISTTFWGWSTADLIQYQVTELHNYLNNKNFAEISKLERIIENIQIKIKSERLPFVFTWTVFLGLFIPLWSSYTDELMSISNDFKLSSLIFLIFALFIIVIALMSPMFIDIRDSVLTRQLKLMKMQDLINEVILAKK